ncbi:ATP-binding protein [Intrasporangium sp.]|uniref:ATP-binding protein n=1 Tax=Intrasporangium sp. TaxID=1925024 RepID=UPI00293B6313|nr:ATP-binding protein [Intrasporangium sp.]MDV3222583.1 ATP-binding protein [Intrasporangium sp.]
MTSQGFGADGEVRAFMRQFQGLLRRMDVELGPEDEAGEPLVQVLTDHLGSAAERLAVVTEEVPAHRLVDADIALEELAASDARARLIGIGGGDMRHHFTLGDLLQAGHHGQGHIPVGQVDYLRLDTGPRPEDTRQVVTAGVRLFRHGGVPVAVRVLGRNPHVGRESAVYEVLAPERDVAEALVTRLREVMDERSVMRGRVITLASDPYGPGLAGAAFVERPALTADDVVLPPGELDRIEHHVVGIGHHRERLQEHGQHLKRGILLYGPPGTGKTHTVRYLLSRTPGTTAVLLSGGALQHIHAAAKIARAHQPAIVVLEDVDLVAEDRSLTMGPQPLLFEVLDALDGLDADADVAFLLTTNRVEDLEVALAQRPGRVDLAAQIPLPDLDGRRALLRLYGRHLFGEDALSAAAERSEGTTASFAKELVRRAVLGAALEGTTPTDHHLATALDELLSDSEVLTRSLLGVRGDETAGEGMRDAYPDAGPAPFSGPSPGLHRGRGAGWFAYRPRP